MSVRGRSLMFVENFFPQDTRVANEANLLTAAGYQVSVVCLRKNKQLPFEVVNGVNVYRVPRFELFKKTEVHNSSKLEKLLLPFKTLIGYVSEYSYFTTMCFLNACRILFKPGFDVIHAHNPPDTLFLAALPFKLLGKKFIFDHHDLCPELYRSRYNRGTNLITRMLAITEWCSLKLANVSIATNESYKSLQMERAGKKPESIFVVRNGPNESFMKMATPSARLRAIGTPILVYIGSLNPQDGVDCLLRAIAILKYKLRRTDFHCVVMGSGDSLDDLRALSAELKLGDCLELTGFVSDTELRENLAAADICVDPDPSSPLNDVSTWIKIMEYMAYGKAIVSFDLKETRFSAGDAASFVPAGDEMAFAKAIAYLIDNPQLRQQMGDFGRRRVEGELQWNIVGRNLVKAYEYLKLA